MRLTTPPLPPKVVAVLNDLGIKTVADLRELNPCAAFLLLKQSGLGVTQTVFWQLVALVENQSPHSFNTAQRLYWQQRLQQHPPVARFPALLEMETWMQVALKQAQLAAQQGEIPVGAVVVYENEIIAAAHNTCIQAHSVCRHAEIQAIEQAGQKLKNHRLNQCDLYVTLEPCSMCAGAIMQARIARLIFAASEPKTGAAGSVHNLFAIKQLNPHTAVFGGVLADTSQQLLQQFFQQRRKQHHDH